MDTIVIHFEGLEPQEVRVKAESNVGVFQQGEWAILFGLCGAFGDLLSLVKFKAKLERWERVRGA